jgi:hypothetical protein
MSSAPFDPTSGYIPAGDQTSNTPPGPIGMMAPDQSAPAPQPNPTANYPASPDQGGPVPQSTDPDAGSNTHGWRAVLKGALGALENHLRGAGEGLITGGIPGALIGAASPGMADRAMQYRQQTMQAELQQRQAQAASAQQNVEIAKDNHEAQMALTHVNLLTAQNAYALQPKSVQEMIDQQEEKFTGQLQMEGFQPVQSGIDSMTDANNIALARNQTDNNSAAFSYVPLRAADGSWSVFHISTPGQPLQNDATLPLLKADGTVTSIPVRKGSMSVGQYMQLYTQRVNDIGKQQSAAAAKIEISNATNASEKNAAQANAANAKANATAASAADWNPKVTADEKKKAELAENIAYNANEVARILVRRPDLVGPASGRITNVEQMAGNNDPDISALATHIHNMAMANSGVHGFRSQEGVKAYETTLLNNFHNGPKAVAGALRASTGSVQTFIDNARPASYKTHSKNGGAVRGMEQ